ncbi:DUF3592 domain-containing protein [Burkholderia sp. Ac-20344]|uniref:DUF3592 domain-containing protein n=1 Tax=Burkholderia sp. Ac-20344 TaxID=2703890 RepID=UPI00197C8A34|nr:DUF3592 domain-containing protein [Burkholderia sp. Ac-20344]MBN3832338.1 DUF3592 domain-containing protein [Burkholderia sp. Ac-20344]
MGIDQASGRDRTDARHLAMQIPKGIVFVVLGTCLLTGALVNVQWTREFLRTSIVVPGRVVKLNAGPHHPEIAFTTRAGEHVDYPQGGAVSVEDGAAVEVRYAADAPSMTARLNTFGAIWGDALFLAGMGSVFFLGGAAELRSGLRERRTRD